MNVLFLSQIVPYPPHGGVLQRGYNVLRELGARGRVHLLAFVHPDEMPTQAAEEESRRALGAFCERIEYFPLWPKRSRLHGVAALAASAASRAPFSVIAHRSKSYADCVKVALGRSGYDVLHVDTIALAQFVPAGCTLPSVVTHHNVESQLMARRAEVESRLPARMFLRREARKLAAFERLATPRFDVNITVSARDAETLSARVPGIRTAVVPNGVDTSYFTPDESAAEPVLIYAGGMNMFANRDAVLHFLHDIWPTVRRQIPGVRFVAVGQDPPAELLAWRDRDPQVAVTGYVSDIRPLVRKAGVYVVPLRVGGGTRLKVLDAMAMGKALVSTSLGCEGLEVVPGRHLIVADAASDFADAVVALLKDGARRTSLGREARALVERRYAWSRIGEALTSAYHDARQHWAAVRKVRDAAWLVQDSSGGPA